MFQEKKPKKFPCLLNIIKKDDATTLHEYFFENPDYDIFKDLKISGKCIYYHSIELGSIQCFMYLTNRLNLNNLERYADCIVHFYDKHPNIFDYYYTIVKMHCQEKNDYECINKIVKNIVKSSRNNYKKLFDKITSEYDFLSQFQNKDFKDELENIIVENKSMWIIHFEKYYRENNICRNNLFAKCLIFSKFDNSKFIKLFKNLNYSDKVHIKKSKYEYTLEFIICLTCNIDDFSKFKICNEKLLVSPSLDGNQENWNYTNFEDELLNLFSELEPNPNYYNSFIIFKEGKNIMFYELLETISKFAPFQEYKHLIQPENHDKLLKMIPFVSHRFIDLMTKHLSYEGFDIEEYLKKYFSYSLKPECVKNSRILLAKIKDEFEKIHNKD